MALFRKRQEVTLADMLRGAIVDIITNQQLFPDNEELLSQEDYSESELKTIEVERVKLAIAYTFVYTMQLGREHRIDTLGRLSEKDLNYYVGIAWGTAVNSVAADATIDYPVMNKSPEAYTKALEGYTVAIARSHDDSKPADDYYYAFEHFCEVVFPERTSNKQPYSSLMLAKFARMHIVTPLVNRVMKNYKITA